MNGPFKWYFHIPYILNITLYYQKENDRWSTSNNLQNKNKQTNNNPNQRRETEQTQIGSIVNILNIKPSLDYPVTPVGGGK